MLELHHYDDKKERWQSHEVRVIENYSGKNIDGVWSLDPYQVTGFGATKEEAYEEFKRKFQYVVDQLVAFNKMLDTDALHFIENEGEFNYRYVFK